MTERVINPCANSVSVPVQGTDRDALVPRWRDHDERLPPAWLEGGRVTTEDIRKVAAARARSERAQQQFRTAIVDAFEGRTGHTVEDIAEAAGLTRERVYQIVKEEKA